MTIMVKRSQLPKEIYFDEKAGSNGVHCLDYKNESSIKYIRDDVFDQQLSAERERYDELKSKYDALVMDNMTLEHNAAEAEKHLPDLINQFVDQERERGMKLVEALENELKDPEPGCYVVSLSVDVIRKILLAYQSPETTGEQENTNPSS